MRNRCLLAHTFEKVEQAKEEGRTFLILRSSLTGHRNILILENIAEMSSA